MEEKMSINKFFKVVLPLMAFALLLGACAPAAAAAEPTAAEAAAQPATEKRLC
jgi:ribosomal protein L12E/L44/L45/RPP1/RPP2